MVNSVLSNHPKMTTTTTTTTTKATGSTSATAKAGLTSTTTTTTARGSSNASSVPLRGNKKLPISSSLSSTATTVGRSRRPTTVSATIKNLNGSSIKTMSDKMNHPSTNNCNAVISSNKNNNYNESQAILGGVKWMYFAIVAPVLLAITVAAWRKQSPMDLLYELSVHWSAVVQQHPLIADRIAMQWWDSWTGAGADSVRHSYRLLKSVGLFSYLTMKLVLFVSNEVFVKFLLYQVLYKMLLQQMALLSPAAAHQVKLLFIRALQYQRSLSYQQVAIEIGILIACYGIHRVYDFLRRQTYYRRMKAWYRSKKLAIAKNYRATIERISNFSSIIAAMIPHALFVTVVAAIKFMVAPSIISWIARETALRSVLQWYYPMIATILLIQDIRDEAAMSNTMNNHTNCDSQSAPTPPSASSVSSVTISKPTTSSKSSSIFSRTRPAPSSSRTLRNSSTSSTSAASSQSTRFTNGSGSYTRNPSSTSTSTAATSAKEKRNVKSSFISSSSTAESGIRTSTSTTRSSSRVKVPSLSSTSNTTSNASKTKNGEIIASSAQLPTSAPSTVPAYVETIHSRTTYWLHYWSIVGAAECLKRVVLLLPLIARLCGHFVSLSSAFQQLEFIFWVWLNVIPYFIIQNVTIQSSISTDILPPSSTTKTNAAIRTSKEQPSLATTTAPSLPPNHFLVHYISTRVVHPFFSRSYESISTAVSTETWNTYVVQNTSKLFVPLVWTNFMSQDRADVLLHLLTECRTIVVPTAVVCSWPISSFGLMYGQYGLPLAKSKIACNTNRTLKKNSTSTTNDRTKAHWLQFWVIHTILSGLVSRFSALLWFIPFSNLFLYASFVFISLIQGTMVDYIYIHFVEMELQAFGLLSSTLSRQTDHNDSHRAVPSIHETKIARLVHWIISCLPRATDDVHEETSINHDGYEIQTLPIPFVHSEEIGNHGSYDKKSKNFTDDNNDDEGYNNDDTLPIARNAIDATHDVDYGDEYMQDVRFQSVHVSIHHDSNDNHQTALMKPDDDEDDKNTFEILKTNVQNIPRTYPCSTNSVSSRQGTLKMTELYQEDDSNQSSSTNEAHSTQQPHHLSHSEEYITETNHEDFDHLESIPLNPVSYEDDRDDTLPSFDDDHDNDRPNLQLLKTDNENYNNANFDDDNDENISQGQGSGRDWMRSEQYCDDNVDGVDDDDDDINDDNYVPKTQTKSSTRKTLVVSPDHSLPQQQQQQPRRSMRVAKTKAMR